jgi:hypothetical protein
MAFGLSVQLNREKKRIRWIRSANQREGYTPFTIRWHDPDDRNEFSSIRKPSNQRVERRIGPGVEPGLKGHEPRVQPLHYPIQG